MKDQILLNLDNPGQLEKLYRTDKPNFKRAFKALYPELQENVLANFWNERLNFASDEISWGSRKELTFVILASLISGLIAKIPAIFHINEDFFYPRNIGFVVFPALMAFFVWKNKMHQRNILVLAGATLAGLIYINLLPDVQTSDTLVLACIHFTLFLWSLLGFAFVGDRSNVQEKRPGFLKYNGDLVVMTGLILISGGILTAVTINLFMLIGIKIDEFYFQNIGIFGLAAAPIIGTYLTHANPQLVGKVSPVIAKIFSPLVCYAACLSGCHDLFWKRSL